MIPAESIEKWKQALPYVERALAEEGTGLYTIHDVLDYLLTDRALLWSDTRAAIVTCMHRCPRGKLLSLWLASGDLEQLISLAADQIRPYAEREGATVIEINGRPGWKRELRKRGFVFSERATLNFPIGANA